MSLGGSVVAVCGRVSWVSGCLVTAWLFCVCTSCVRSWLSRVRRGCLSVVRWWCAVGARGGGAVCLFCWWLVVVVGRVVWLFAGLVVSFGLLCCGLLCFVLSVGVLLWAS